MNDRNRRTPVALAADAPIAQAPGGLKFAQVFGGEQFGDFVDRLMVRHTIQNTGIDGNDSFLISVPILPLFGIVIKVGILGNRMLRPQ